MALAKVYIELAEYPWNDSVKSKEFKIAAESYEEELARTFGYLDELKEKKINPKGTWANIFSVVTVGAISALTTAGVIDEPLGSGNKYGAILVGSIGTLAKRLIDPAISYVTSLVTDYRLRNYDKLVIGAQPIFIRANNPMYIESLLARPEIRPHKHPGKLKLSQHQLRKI